MSTRTPGPLKQFEAPATGPELRIDTGVRQGDVISFHYDPMIAKMIAHGADRHAAIDRLLEGLDAMRVEGVATNIEFLKRLMENSAFRAGDSFTGFIPAHAGDLL